MTGLADGAREWGLTPERGPRAELTLAADEASATLFRLFHSPKPRCASSAHGTALRGIPSMSIHSSLKISGNLKGSRSVLTRTERLQILMEQARWDESKSVYGLPKVRTKFKVATKKKKKKKDDEE
jgi:small basic protein (TIGR04137 family)